MIDLKIVNNPRQGSCILGLITAPNATGKTVAVISDYKGMSVLVDSLNYLTIGYTSDPDTTIPVAPGSTSIYEQSLPVSYSSDQYYVDTQVNDDRFFLTNKSVCNRNVNIETLLYYEQDLKQYCWKSEQTGESYDALRTVGLEIVNNIAFYTISGKQVIPPYDISLPSKTYDGLPLPTGVYSFKIYMDALPAEPMVVGFDSYNLSTGKIDYQDIPVNLERIYDRTDERDYLSVESDGDIEYTVPYNASSDEFGAMSGSNRMTVVEG